MAKTMEHQIERIFRELSKDQAKALKTGTMRASAYVAGEIASWLMASTKGRGHLARSFRAEFLYQNETEVAAHAVSRGAAEKYAGIQNYGGVIRPTTRRFLAVPIKGAGVPRGKWPRDFGKGELKLIPRKGRPSLLVKELMGSKALARRSYGPVKRTWIKAIKPMFVLVPSVMIRAKHYLRLIGNRTENEVADIMSRAWSEGVK